MRNKATSSVLVFASGLILALALFTGAVSSASEAAAASTTESSASQNARVLVGEYDWKYQDRPGPLRVELTPTAEDQWDVAFRFRFDGRDRTYLGTAEGSLADGPLEGTVLSENRRRTFTFEAEIEDGKFEGTHAETTSGRPSRTGTLWLAEAGSEG